MFTPEQDKLIDRLVELNGVVNSLLDQRNSLGRKSSVVRQGYDIAICNLLETIKRLSKEIGVGVHNDNQN